MVKTQRWICDLDSYVAMYAHMYICFWSNFVYPTKWVCVQVWVSECVCVTQGTSQIESNSKSMSTYHKEEDKKIIWKSKADSIWTGEVRWTGSFSFCQSFYF